MLVFSLLSVRKTIVFETIFRENYKATTGNKMVTYACSGPIKTYVRGAMPWVDVENFPGFALTAEEEAELVIEEKKRKKMRFYVDEDVPPLVSQILRERGYNVRDVKEEGRSGLPDETHLADAR